MNYFNKLLTLSGALIFIFYYGITYGKGTCYDTNGSSWCTNSECRQNFNLLINNKYTYNHPCPTMAISTSTEAKQHIIPTRTNIDELTDDDCNSIFVQYDHESHLNIKYFLTTQEKELMVFCENENYFKNNYNECSSISNSFENQRKSVMKKRNNELVNKMEKCGKLMTDKFRQVMK